MNISWKYTDERPLRVFTSFSGYDSQCLALKYLGIPYALVGWSEFDPESRKPINEQPAVVAHNALFPEDAEKNYGDVSKIDWAQVPDFDLFTYSFPCTDISNAGLQKGLSEGSGTRSSLLWECKKVVEIKRPSILLMENVKALVSGKFRPFFLSWCDYLTTKGYTNFAQVINAKDQGIPQNRERIFLVSTREDSWFNFPQPKELKLRLRDLLEEKVDEKYYIDDLKVAEFVRQLEKKKLDMICAD